MPRHRKFLVSALEGGDWTTRPAPSRKYFDDLLDAVQEAARLATSPSCRAVAIRSCAFAVRGGWMCGKAYREDDPRWVPAEAIADEAARLKGLPKDALARKLVPAPYDLNPGVPPKYVTRKAGPGFVIEAYDPGLGPAPESASVRPGSGAQTRGR